MCENSNYADIPLRSRVRDFCCHADDEGMIAAPTDEYMGSKRNNRGLNDSFT